VLITQFAVDVMTFLITNTTSSSYGNVLTDPVTNSRPCCNMGRKNLGIELFGGSSLV